jgi:hypothetical protein
LSTTSNRYGLYQGTLTEEGKLRTIDLLIKIARVIKKEEIFLYYEKQLISTSWYKEVNRTEPFPSDRLPWHLPFLSFFLLKTLI